MVDILEELGGLWRYIWRLDDDLDALLYQLMTLRLGAGGASLDWTLGDLVDVELDVELIEELGAGGTYVLPIFYLQAGACYP